MKHKVIIDADTNFGWKTVVVEFVNTIERPNMYTVYTAITDGYKPIYETTEEKEHEQALKYLIKLNHSEFINSKDCCGFEVEHKQTFITEKNPYISKFEYIKRFLWE